MSDKDFEEFLEIVGTDRDEETNAPIEEGEHRCQWCSVGTAVFYVSVRYYPNKQEIVKLFMNVCEPCADLLRGYPTMSHLQIIKKYKRGE